MILRMAGRIVSVCVSKPIGYVVGEFFVDAKKSRVVCS